MTLALCFKLGFTVGSALSPHSLFSFSLASVSYCEGDGAGSSGLSSGAPAMRPPTGAGVDPHAVPVCGAGGLWHGLPGTEEVHPQGLGSPVRDCFRKHKKV